MTVINKAYATREELLIWNRALEDMARGDFSPEIIEMIADAEQEMELDRAVERTQRRIERAAKLGRTEKFDRNTGSWMTEAEEASQ
jgi:hypothetical protein